MTYISSHTRYLIILGGGSSTRFNYSLNKLDICHSSGKTLIHQLLQKMADMQYFDKIIVVYNRHINVDEISSNIHVVLGGDTRIKSLANALNYLQTIVSYNPHACIVIHDGARPYIQPQRFQQVVNAAFENGAAGLYKKCVSTIMHIDTTNSCAYGSIPRNAYVESHTPQAILWHFLNIAFACISPQESSMETEILNLCVHYNPALHPKMIECTHDDILKVTYLHDYMYLQLYERVINKKVLLTGPTGCLGRVIAEKLRLYGFEIIPIFHTKPLDNIIPSQTSPRYYICDMQNPLSVDNCLLVMNQDQLKVDYVVMAHGLLKSDEAAMDAVVQVNYVQPMRFLLGLLKLLNKKLDVCINLSSSSVNHSRSHQQIYSSSKSAMHNFIHGLALDYKGTCFYNVVPRRVDSESRKALMQLSETPDGEDMLKPDDVAEVVLQTLISASLKTSGNDIFIR